MKKVKIEKIKPIFVDDRGTISDILEKEVKHIGIIFSNPASVRGNHYHKKSTQYMYVIKGRMEMRTKDMRTENSEVETKTIEEGDIISIPAMIAHSFKALEETYFLDITTESRSGNKYEEDTFRIQF